MVVSYNLINEIFKTLPVGYYLGRRIAHTLHETDPRSYFDPAKDVIVVSYPMIASTLANVNCTREDFEELVRTILYHEISHVILTPDMRMNTVINIFEDERIETIMRTYYMGTNFRKVVRLINNYNGEAPIDKDSAFYHLVRYRVGEKKWLESLVSLLNRHKNLTSRNDDYNYNTGTYYSHEIMEFYNEFCEEWEMKNPQQQSSEGDRNSNSNDNSEDSNSTIGDETSTSFDAPMDEENEEETSEEIENKSDETTSTNSMDESKENNEEEISNTEEENTEETENNGTGEAGNKEQEDDFNEDIIDVESIINDAIQSVINAYNNENLTSTLKGVVDRKLKQNKKNGAAISSYSGQLNKRAVANREDYRWWTAQNREGNIRRFSNVHFNLFIDNSGSFRSNDDKMNTFIKSLDKVAKATPQFTFDVITINNHEVEEWEGHDKIFESYGGSALFNTIADVIKRHDKRNAEVYTIVLFDGDIHYHDNTYAGDSNDALRHFNRPNTVIISDDENKCYLDAIKMNKAKVKYVKNYCEEFINTIITLLEKAI